MTTPDISAPLAALAAFPAELRRVVLGLSDEQIHQRPAPGEWSVLEVVGHLLDIEALFNRRIGRIISAENPALEAMDQDAVVQQRDYQNKQIRALLQTFVEQRAETVENLRLIRPANLLRTGVHAVRGQISIADIVTGWPGHDQNHLQQILANVGQK